MEYKKRDRTGETYGDWTVIKAGNQPLTWVVRCKCGRENTVSANHLSKLTCCRSCSGKRNNKKLGKFLETMENTLAPKKPQLKEGVLYKLDYSRCLYPAIGVLIQEYQNSASFKVIDCTINDRNLIRNLGGVINVGKSKVAELDR